MVRRIDRLQAANTKTPTEMHRRINAIIDQVEGNITDLSDVLAQVVAAQSAADAAAADAASAQTTANTANTTANTVQRDDSIADSWVSPGTPLSATDAGANATITIAAHTRKYNDATSVSVNGGSLTGRSYSTLYYIYYDQTSRAGGAVTYQSATNPNTALAGAAAGRHYVGKITTPAAGGGGTTGTYNPPSGGGGVLGPEVP